MNRRQFIGGTTALTAPLFLNGLNVFAGQSAANPVLQNMALAAANCGKVLVIIQLNGGNDGLNTVIPLDRYSELSAARSSIMIPSASVLALNGTTTTGLHPSLSGLQNLYNTGKVNIVQGVTYPSPNYSHFFAQDIWFTASGSVPTATTGWLGRELDMQYPGYPDGPPAYPNATSPDPLAVQIGGVIPLLLQGPNVSMGYNAPNPASLINVATATTGPAPVSDYGTELTFLRLMQSQSNAYTSRIQTAYSAQATQSTMYPASGNSLADQLKVVARLIGGGLQTSIYIVNHQNSFDTHVDQVVAGATTTGTHANMLSALSVAISAFQNDITLMGKSNKVTGMTFSEFGRRVISNASNGTDHGSGAPVIFFGDGVNPAILGTSPVLPAVPTASTQVPLQYDFRQLYTSIMQDWFCMSAANANTILGSSYTKIPIFNTTPLAIEDITLNGKYEGGKASLSFSVEGNQLYDKYYVEYSTDGINFNKVRTIANDSLNYLENYKYEYEISASKLYFRIRGIFKRGGEKFSNIILLRENDNKQLISVYPNPVTDFTIFVKLFEQPNTHVDINIYSLIGAKIYYNRINQPGKLLTLKVPAERFAKNTHYVLEIIYGQTSVHEQIMFS